MCFPRFRSTNAKNVGCHSRKLRKRKSGANSSAIAPAASPIEMTRQAYKRTVYVWAIPHVVTVYQKSKTVWAAVGDYMGERIEVEGSSANVTAKWVEAARLRDN